MTEQVDVRCKMLSESCCVVLLAQWVKPLVKMLTSNFFYLSV